MASEGKIKLLYDKHKEMILYLIFGGLTTVINYIVYFIFVSVLGVHYEISNCIAWIAGVTFAYFTNRSIVFNSQAKDAKSKVIEAVEFVLARVFSLIAENILLFIFIDVVMIHPDKDWNELIAKFIGAVVVVILNYFASKFVIFKKDKKNNDRK